MRASEREEGGGVGPQNGQLAFRWPEGGEKAPVVFLDRDGTLNFDPGYLSDPNAVQLLPGVRTAIARLNRASFKTVVVTNQSGIGRGLIREETLEAVHRRLRELLAESDAWLDAIYYCPHRPEEACGCRKPSAGLVDRACRELALSPQHAFVIGDKATDVELARNIGAIAVLVLSGNHPEEEQARMAARGLSPDCVARNLEDAVEWILKSVEVVK
jgi:histidinol-phosphate phosphatase family protein